MKPSDWSRLQGLSLGYLVILLGLLGRQVVASDKILGKEHIRHGKSKTLCLLILHILGAF